MYLDSKNRGSYRLEPVAEVAVEITMTVVEVVGPDLSTLLNEAIREANVRGMNRTDLEDQHLALLAETERATEALTLGAAELDRRAQENDTLKAQIRGLEAKVKELRTEASDARGERDRAKRKMREVADSLRNAI